MCLDAGDTGLSGVSQPPPWGRVSQAQCAFKSLFMRDLNLDMMSTCLGASDQGALPIWGCGDTPFLTQRPYNKEVLQKPWTQWGGGWAGSVHPKGMAKARGGRAQPWGSCHAHAPCPRMQPAWQCGHCVPNLSRCAWSICGHHHHLSYPGLSVCCHPLPSPECP